MFVKISLDGSGQIKFENDTDRSDTALRCHGCQQPEDQKRSCDYVLEIINAIALFGAFSRNLRQWPAQSYPREEGRNLGFISLA